MGVIKCNLWGFFPPTLYCTKWIVTTWKVKKNYTVSKNLFFQDLLNCSAQCFWSFVDYLGLIKSSRQHFKDQISSQTIFLFCLISPSFLFSLKDPDFNEQQSRPRQFSVWKYLNYLGNLPKWVVYPHDNVFSCRQWNERAWGARYTLNVWRSKPSSSVLQSAPWL